MGHSSALVVAVEQSDINFIPVLVAPLAIRMEVHEEEEVIHISKIRKTHQQSIDQV